MNCPNCHTDNRPRARFCNECGNPLPSACPSCGASNRAGAKFCDACGTSLASQTPSPALPQEIPQPLPQAGLATATPLPATPQAPDAERRQLTVMFCDLVGSTHLSSQLDPEELRDVVRAYQAACNNVIQRFEGYVAQHLGDGLLIYFGYPAAHEDDAQRAVRTGLGIIDAMQALNQQFAPAHGVQLAVRIGIHTGLVVIGDIGAGERQEQLALGETPNLAARLQELAEPDTVVISNASHELAQGYFEFDALGEHLLRGVEASMMIYRALRESGVRNRLDIASARGLTPLVGRESAVALLQERWRQAQSGQGQVVLLSGEAGIGKSRLAQALKDLVADESHIQWECRSSPYFTNSALYPIIDLMQRTLRWRQDDTAEAKLEKFEQGLSQYRLPLEESAPLIAPLLSIRLPEERYSPLNLSPQLQRQKTLEAILAIILELAERQPILFILEDLHWTDPTTLALLDLLIDQTPAAAIFALLTRRPDYQPSWSRPSYLTEVTVNRLSTTQIERMAMQLADGKELPAEIVQQVVEKTDGVPLYVEEMTKAVLESGVLKEIHGHYELSGPMSSLSIPMTLQDSLMARLDRLMTAKVIAQLGATIGRQFSYALLQAVSGLEETILQHELSRLVDSELVHQRGLPPQATYIFKHALVQDIAYQSLVRSTRQQYHQRIAQILETQFPETARTQPEWLAHHFTEAGLHEQAVGYWRQAGEQAVQRSSHLEAIGHLSQGLDVIQRLPETPERLQQELALQSALGPALLALKGWAAPEVEQTYTRARELGIEVGDASQLFLALRGLSYMNYVRAKFQTAREFGEQLMQLANQQQDPEQLLVAHQSFGAPLLLLGELPLASEHLAHGIALYSPQEHRSMVFRYGHDLGVNCLGYDAVALWLRGDPEQAIGQAQEALTLGQEIGHPYSLCLSIFFATMVSQYCQDHRTTYTQADNLIKLSTEPLYRTNLKITDIFDKYDVSAPSAHSKVRLTPCVIPLACLVG